MQLRPTVLLSSVALLATAFAPVTHGASSATSSADDDATVVAVGDCVTLDDGWNHRPVPYDLCPTQGWFRSRNDTRLDNIHYLSTYLPSPVGAPPLDDDLPTWTAQPPPSVTAGAGGGYLGQATTARVLGHGRSTGVTYEGIHQGALRSIAIEQYVALSMPVREAYEMVVSVRTDRGSYVYLSDRTVGDVVPVERLGPGLGRIRFVLTDLPFPRFLYRDWPSNTFRERQDVEVTISPLRESDEELFLYGAAEVPSSIVFNPVDLEGYAQIDASDFEF